MSVIEKKVLLVEDDESMRRFIEVVLKRESYEVTTAKDGLEGLNLALVNNYDAVIADAIMPNMSGYDLCRMLRQNPNYKDTPLILLSGLENNDGNHPANAYLLKGDKLKESLSKTLSGFLS